MESGPATLNKTIQIENMSELEAELEVALQALRRMKKPCQVVMITESELFETACREWLPEWTRTGWINSKGKEIDALQKWQELQKMIEYHENVSFLSNQQHEYKNWMKMELAKCRPAV